MDLKRCYAAFFIASLLFAFLSPRPASSRTLADYQNLALDLTLHERLAWHALLHYQPYFQGFQSESDDPNFFYSPRGRVDPAAELLASLAALFAPSDRVGPFGLHPRCRFPARWEWLRDTLNIKASDTEPIPCPHYQKWTSDLDIAEVYLNYPGQSIYSAATMFGHTFFRIAQRGRVKKGRLFNYAVNYAAKVDLSTTNVAIYSFLGVFGGYDGAYTLIPYYSKIQEYSEAELREIWEYRIRLTSEERQRMMAHLWELRFVTLPYYYFRENCSYHLMGLLDVARPELQLRQKFKWFAIPTDTIRALLDEDLLDPPEIRLSRHQKALRHYASLDQAGQAWLSRALDDKNKVFTPEFAELSPKNRALILDILHDSFLIEGDSSTPLLRKKILSLRSKIKVSTPDDYPLTPQDRLFPPEESHESSLTTLQYRGSSAISDAISLKYRPSLHGLMDRDRGMLAHSEIIFFEFELNYALAPEITERQHHPLYLKRLSLIQTTVLPPIDPVYKPLSFTLNAVLHTGYFNLCADCTAGQIVGDLGYTYALGPGALSLMLASEAIASHELGPGQHLSIGASARYLQSFGDQLKFTVAARRLYRITSEANSGTDYSGVYAGSFDIAYYPSRNLMFSASLAERHYFEESATTLTPPQETVSYIGVGYFF